MKQTASLLHSLIIASLIVGLSLLSVQPSYAWWFLAEKEQTTVQPTHTSGLVLSPWLDSLIPKFILEPLQKKEAEQPPVVQASQPSQLVVQPLVTPSQANQTNSSIAQQMLTQVNQLRAQHGLTALSLNSHLTKSAQDYADRMSRERFFSHTSPDGQTFRQRNEQAGYTNWQWMGENIGQGQSTVAEVVEDWFNSPAHRDNLLSDKARELGVGFTAGSPNFWVQEFGLQF